MTKKKKTPKQPKLDTQSPSAYIVTGLVMGVVGYVVFLLATDSGSLIQYVVFITAFVWGAIRIIQGVKLFFHRKQR